MILRHISESIRRQDWFTVLVEVVIVVVGVFVGIEMANWNEARADKGRAQGYYHRLVADLDADLAGYRDRLAFWEAVSANGELGLDHANGDSVPDQDYWQLLLAYFQASQVAEFWTITTTYDELRSAGELDLLDDLDLRNALAYYHSNAGNPVLTERPAYREHIRGIIPLAIQNYIWGNCYASDIRGNQTLLDCPSPITNQEASDLVAEISNDKDLMEELRYWMSTMKVAGLIGRDRAASAAQLRASIASKIQSSGPRDDN